MGRARGPWLVFRPSPVDIANAVHAAVQYVPHLRANIAFVNLLEHDVVRRVPC